jgi:serine protease inhibitor
MRSISRRTWLYEFEKKDTYGGQFNLEGGGTSAADFMNVEGDFNYTANEDFAAVELPYGDSTFSMVVMLPAAGREVTDIVEKMIRGTVGYLVRKFLGYRGKCPSSEIQI